jgi:hypothetical protein
MKPAGDRHRRHVMTIINKIRSIFDNRVASEARWVKINEVAATAGNEFEYQRLVSGFSALYSAEAGRKTGIGERVANWKYRDREWFADQLP